MNPPDRYAVFGHPIGHSQSPRIHTLFAAQTGQVMSYTAQDVPAESFETEVRRFFSDGGQGLNCTVPLKELAFRFADTLSERARRAGAVNTLARREDGGILGDNTDGAGLVRDLIANLGLALHDRRILILGAGGATRGILAPIMEHRPSLLTIANRTATKAAQLAEEFSDLGAISGGGFGDLTGKSYDLILNATAASLSGDVPELPKGILASRGSCYDLAYGKLPTAFVRWGNTVGAVISSDGIGMLVEQAAEAFMIWRNVRPDTQAVIRVLNEARDASVKL